MKDDYKPWEEYPEIWKTEGQFWTYLRGSLRRALWMRSPIKLTYKKGQMIKPPSDYEGRGKSGAYCALTGEFINNSALEVDHIEGNVSLSSWEDVLPFILHLVPPKGSMQLVSKEAHKIKSYADKHKLTFEEAKVEVVIERMKQSVGDQKEELLIAGFEEGEISNHKNRRECYRVAFNQYLEGN